MTIEADKLGGFLGKLESFDTEKFGEFYKGYLEWQRERLELVYQRAIKPQLEMMMEGVAKRRLLLSLADQYRAERGSLWRNMEGKTEPERETAYALEGELHQFFLNRAGDEIVPGNEKIWLAYHLLTKVYGVPMEVLQKFDDAQVVDWQKRMDEATPTQLAQEAKLLASYNRQYTEFAQTHKDALRPAIYKDGDIFHPISSTPGSTKREIFNAVLFASYNFDPRLRESWQKRGNQKVVGKPIAAVRKWCEELWVEQAVDAHLKFNHRQISATGHIS